MTGFGEMISLWAGGASPFSSFSSRDGELLFHLLSLGSGLADDPQVVPAMYSGTVSQARQNMHGFSA